MSVFGDRECLGTATLTVQDVCKTAIDALKIALTEKPTTFLARLMKFREESLDLDLLETLDITGKCSFNAYFTSKD